MQKFREKERKLGETKKPKDNNISHCKIPISPDRELLVWEKWIHIRKEETTRLGNAVRRAPIDLAINLLKDTREDTERKLALVNAQLGEKAVCGYGFYEQPLRLKQLCEDDPVYEVKRTAAEIGRPRIIEHIGVPKSIQVNELGMSGTPKRIEGVILNAEYNKYRQKREEELKAKLANIDPFRPSTSQLIVEGFKPKPPAPKIPRLPNIIIEPPAKPPQEFIEGVYAVKINKSVWYKNIPGQQLDHLASYEKNQGHEDCSSWTYYFNVPIKRIGRGKLLLQNLGTVTLRYYWKKLKRQLAHIPQDMHQVFFFNKNEDVLSPGQCRVICFTFVSDTPGVYHEFWELIFTNICFFETVNEKIQFDLCGDAIEDTETMQFKLEVFKARIQDESLKYMANEILLDALERAFTVVPQSYPYKKYFLEAQMFVMKNPVCYYHQTEVAKLSEMYTKEVAPGQPWDLSIGTWRQEMMAKQYDDRMRLFDALKISHSDLVKPWFEGENLLKDKYRAVNQLWIQLANKLDADYDRLTKLFMEQTEASQTLVDIVIFKSSKNTTGCEQLIRSIFYLHAYEHVAYTMEQCAGVLSSLDSNRWIEFDFCRS